MMNHEVYILRCLELAKKGIGTTRPNPSVGAVIVHNNKIIGEGFTSPYGGPHAEVNAINAVQNQELLKEATIYVTLEPCSHHGKTPPCADLIIEKGIPDIVIGCVDTNSLVAGKGIERLKKAGRNVIVGVCQKDCIEHHRRFFTVQNKKRPYIILKWAETKDGFIAPLTKDEQKPVWISNQYSQQLVHKWRSEEHAILVGTNTVIADNPSLTVRNWKGNNPIRIVIDKNLRIPSEVTVFDGNVKTIIVTEEKKEENQHVIYEQIDFSFQVAEQICEVLHKHQIQSVIIEGGAKTLQTFIDANLWDEARVFIGDVVFGEGVKHPVFSTKLSSEEKIDNDILRIYRND
ncbi:bifunctional diaminohydroxyphosphoribosylaminopyrimidine deaminase/5-amino-6-(5-phosphoribosylamino)uracil reductase RibD [Tenacibaculum mesophilum]|uniref:Riboflavin biosynthesis protein RibD n=1 Tax=Tenacibaculum mesophilum TaxID=104268 RepID=A0ABM7CD90_9FLAO|nr:bifunctional diaminohydroxyphosphoribosylaminopyrimidine deaminase/5-amino-6-(5-phosphoribosylamino)uracil reductase RibD [Tenacibaculum mesophilum]AZJ31697.1 bifunctional diaminohydroxyphosphoribosylaminopyrimidine deaminase/5-amino-6-(5-phosphoribosylamino)uracil reductase RibD [Tenacibaculum mesophilum]QFS26951.1 bifunctional diaminohydroxyphosphoribosylaminopyrimidine deaminase/5-amino-6-(5-phosphoribosylamino)uracil reductase RibD [Tenacibaculum mesophilum]